MLATPPGGPVDGDLDDDGGLGLLGLGEGWAWEEGWWYEDESEGE